MKRTIGKVARALDMNARTIRYYESIGLVPEPEREGTGWISAGRRVYEDDDVERLRFIKQARHLDFGIDEIKRVLEAYESGPPCGCNARPLLQTLLARRQEEVEESIQALQAIRTELQALQARTEALSGKTPDELLKKGAPTVTDALFGRQATGKRPGKPDA